MGLNIPSATRLIPERKLKNSKCTYTQKPNRKGNLCAGANCISTYCQDSLNSIYVFCRYMLGLSSEHWDHILFVGPGVKLGDFFFGAPLISIPSSLDSLVCVFIHFLFFHLPDTLRLFFLLSQTPSFCLPLFFSIMWATLWYKCGLDVLLSVHCPSLSLCHIRPLRNPNISWSPPYGSKGNLGFSKDTHTLDRNSS